MSQDDEAQPSSRKKLLLLCDGGMRVGPFIDGYMIDFTNLWVGLIIFVIVVGSIVISWGIYLIRCG